MNTPIKQAIPANEKVDLEKLGEVVRKIFAYGPIKKKTKKTKGS
jgi:hypothetical protein